jgi:hypothetical protein
MWHPKIILGDYSEVLVKKPIHRHQIVHHVYV